EAASGLVWGSSEKAHFHNEPSVFSVTTVSPLPATASQFVSLPIWIFCSAIVHVNLFSGCCQMPVTRKVPSVRTPTMQLFGNTLLLKEADLSPCDETNSISDTG